MAGGSGAVRAGRAFVELFADTSRLGRDLKEGVAMMRRFAASARAIGQSMVTAGLKMATPFALATAIFVGFEDQMAEVRAVTQATASDFAALTNQAKHLGRTTSFMAKEVAGAQTELGRAGFNPSQITSATASILNLARGTKTELAQAAQIGADSLRAFRLEASLMPQVADVLVATANNSSQGLVDLFEALKTVGPVAADVGASISDTAAAIGVLANNGIKGTLAGNALKRAYLNLANPAIRKKIEALTNVSAVDSAGNLRPLASVITDIGKATNGLPNAKRLDIFSQIFGDRAVVAASAFAGSAGNFRDLQGVLDGAAGTAERTAKIMDDTLGGSFRKLLSAAEGVAIAVGETIAPAVRTLADYLTNAAGAVTAFVKDNQGLVIGLAGASAVAIAAGVALIAVGGAVSVLAFGVSGLVSAAGALGFIPGLFAKITSPAKMATAAVLALAAATGLASTANASDTPAPAGQKNKAPGGLSNVAGAAASAASAVLPLVGSFAGLRAAQGVVGGVASGLMTIPRASSAVSKSMIANSVAARRMGGAVGAVSRITGRTLAGAAKAAHRPLRALTAVSLSTAGTLTTTGGILLGKVASGFDVAAKSIGGASRKLSTAGRSAVLASTALTRTAGRASTSIFRLGRSATLVSLDLAGLVSAMLRVSAAKAVGGLKATTQAMGGLAISAFRATRGMVAAAASITAANVAAVAATGFRSAATGMRFLSMGALNAAKAMKAVAVSIRGTMAIARIGGAAAAAATMISGAVAGLFAIASSPVALFMGLAAGAVAALIYAAGSVGALKNAVASLVGAAGGLFGRIASQAGAAWGLVSQTGMRAIGGIVNRIKAGDMQGAFQIATTGIALMWSHVMESFVDTWLPVKLALVNGWRATSSLFGSIFGGAIDFVRDLFAGFASWFSSDGGAGSMPNTMADAVASMAELMATGWSMIKSTAGDAMDVLADGWDSYIAGITNAWSTAIGFIQKGWTRLKAMFDSDIDVEAEVKDIDRANAAAATSRNNERDQKINNRAAASKAAKEKSKTELAGQLATIQEDRRRKNAENKKAIEEEKAAVAEQAEARKKAFDDAMAAADPVASAGSTGAPATAAVAAKQAGVDPVTGKTAAELVQDWKTARTERDQYKAELSGANRNKGINPNTGRTKKEIEKDYVAAGNNVSGAIAGVGRASATNESSGNTSFGLPSATAAEQRQAGKSLAEAFNGEVEPMKRNEAGQLLDPESGRPITDVLDDDKKATTAAQSAKVAGAGASLNRVEGRLSSSTGSFSSQVASRIASSSTVMSRVAKATEAAAESQKKIEENTAATAEAVKNSQNGFEAE